MLLLCLLAGSVLVCLVLVCVFVLVLVSSVFVCGLSCVLFRTLRQKFTGMSSEFHNNFAGKSNGSAVKKGIATTQPCPQHAGTLALLLVVYAPQFLFVYSQDINERGPAPAVPFCLRAALAFTAAVQVMTPLGSGRPTRLSVDTNTRGPRSTVRMVLLRTSTIIGYHRI